MNYYLLLNPSPKGHPDKVPIRYLDALLDEVFWAYDPTLKVACEHW